MDLATWQFLNSNSCTSGLARPKIFVFWGVNDGETPQKVQKSLDEHQPPWPVLLDPNREVAEAHKVRAIPKFIIIDYKNGYWQYSFGSSNIIDGQPINLAD